MIISQNSKLHIKIINNITSVKRSEYWRVHRLFPSHRWTKCVPHLLALLRIKVFVFESISVIVVVMVYTRYELSHFEFMEGQC